jgi:hypothetical protein
MERVLRKPALCRGSLSPPSLPCDDDMMVVNARWPQPNEPESNDETMEMGAPVPPLLLAQCGSFTVVTNEGRMLKSTAPSPRVRRTTRAGIGAKRAKIAAKELESRPQSLTATLS